MSVPQSWLFYAEVAGILFAVAAIFGAVIEVIARAIGAGWDDWEIKR